MKKYLFLILFGMSSYSYAGFSTSNLTATSTFTVTQSTIVLNGTTYYWRAGTGSNGQALTIDGSRVLSFSTISGTSIYPATSTIFSPFGDNISTLTFTGLGSTAGVLKMSGTGVVSVSTYSLVGAIGFSIDGSSAAIVAGSTRSIVIPYDCSISSWSLVADQSGSISIDIKRSTFASYPPSTSIVGSGNKPTLTSQNHFGATPASWTATYINAGDVLSFVVNTASTVQWVNLILWVTKI